MKKIPETETIVSIDLNFSNGGSSHTASVKTVLKAKDPSNEEDELGSLLASNGGRTIFSNEKLDKLMSNFAMTEKTTSKDSKMTSISRSYQDLTSLRLKSHCFLVRGSNCHPSDRGSFGRGANGNNQFVTNNGAQYNNIGATQSQYGSLNNKYATMFYYGELPNSPITDSTFKFPYKQPSINGGIIRIGNIYNEESSVNSRGIKTSLVYQSGALKENLSYNSQSISNFYKLNPDLANYNLKYGYTLAEAKIGFAQAGITVAGLPESDSNKVLFQESGTLDSILSSIASKYGYYWFVDPFVTGKVTFINSSSASNLSVTNPLKQSGVAQTKYVNASFSENFLKQKIVNGFSATIEKQEQTFEFDESNRFTRFHKVDINPFLIGLGISNSLYAAFYGAFVADKLDTESFDVIACIATYLEAKGKNIELEWGDSWPDNDGVANKTVTWDKVAGLEETQKLMLQANRSEFDLKNGRFIKLSRTQTGKPPQKPSQTTGYNLIKDVFNILTNTIYCSNVMSAYKAKRTQWNNADMSISGPYKLENSDEDTRKPAFISDVDALQDLLSFIKKRGKDKKLPLNYLFENSGSSGSSGAYGFIGRVSGNQKHSVGRGEGELDYDIINSKEYQFIHNPQTSQLWLGFSTELEKKIESLIASSQGLWREMLAGNSDSSLNTIKAYFKRSKTPTDQEDSEKTRKQEEAEARRQANLDALAERQEEVAERFDERYYSLKNNGATGNHLCPVSLDLKNGSISDILALESSNISSFSSRGQNLQSSSRTILGLSIPSNFRVTISGISIQLSSAGITTTINESTVKILPPDQQMIIDSNSKSVRSLSPISRFKASQKNFFGL